MSEIIKISDLPTELSVEELMQVKGGDGPTINCSTQGSGVCSVKDTGICSGEGAGFSCTTDGSGIILEPVPTPEPISCNSNYGPLYHA